jgi:hypothetical protein
MTREHLRDTDPVAYFTQLLDSYYRHQRSDLELMDGVDAHWQAEEYDRYQLKIRKLRLELQRLKEVAA